MVLIAGIGYAGRQHLSASLRLAVTSGERQSPLPLSSGRAAAARVATQNRRPAPLRPEECGTKRPLQDLPEWRQLVL